MNKIKARSKKELKSLIEKEIKIQGIHANLNHLDVSKLKNLSHLFEDSIFNGDISQWNTTNVTDMRLMFHNSQFNQDISGWDVAQVKDMGYMFAESSFNSDISQWNTSNVIDMGYMFYDSNFNQEISNWNVLKLESMCWMFTKAKFNQKLDSWTPINSDSSKTTFKDSICILPYWANCQTNEEIRTKIEVHQEKISLENVLSDNIYYSKKLKI